MIFENLPSIKGRRWPTLRTVQWRKFSAKPIYPAAFDHHGHSTGHFNGSLLIGGFSVSVSVSFSLLQQVNMYRYGLLSLHLLPENSNTGIVIITDGMLCLPNSTMLESMLAQLRNSTIACSFIQVGSSPHPDSCLGYLPYTDLMKFISIATFGAYLPNCPQIVSLRPFCDFIPVFRTY